jgi:Toprim domain
MPTFTAPPAELTPKLKSLRDKMDEAGIHPDAWPDLSPPPNGAKPPFQPLPRADKALSNRSCWIIVHHTLISGGRYHMRAYIGNFARPDLLEHPIFWSESGFSDDDILEANSTFQANSAYLKPLIEAERLKKFNKGNEFLLAQPVADPNTHPYFLSKKCRLPKASPGFEPRYFPCNTHPGRKNIAFPYKNTQGEIVAWRTIEHHYSDPSKFVKFCFEGSRTTAGGFYPISPISLDDPSFLPQKILPCEGIATAASVYEHCPDYTVVAVGDAQNLGPVTHALRKRFLTSDIIIPADHDRDTELKTGLNTGAEAARKAAISSGSRFCRPEFPPGTKGSDFNDLAQLIISDPNLAIPYNIKEQIDKAFYPEGALENLKPFVIEYVATHKCDQSEFKRLAQWIETSQNQLRHAAKKRFAEIQRDKAEDRRKLVALTQINAIDGDPSLVSPPTLDEALSLRDRTHKLLTICNCKWFIKLTRPNPVKFPDPNHPLYKDLVQLMEWSQCPKEEVQTLLRKLGWLPEPEGDQPVSALSNILLDITQYNYVSYAGALAGWPPGIHTSPLGDKFLVTHRPKLIVPTPGPWPVTEKWLARMMGVQVIYFFAWLKLLRIHTLAWSGFIPGYPFGSTSRWRPNLVLILIGPPDSGKGLLQAFVITPAIGNRICFPMQYLSGDTTFNEDLFGAEHLCCHDDDVSANAAFGNSDPSRTIASRIKSLLFDEPQRCHGKNGTAFTAFPRWGMSISANKNAIAARGIPEIDDDTEGKFLMLECEPGGLPINRAELDADLDKIIAERPHLHHWLDNTFEIPEAILHPRTGIKAYLNPELLQFLEGQRKHREFLDVIDKYYYRSDESTPPAKVYLSGSSAKFYKILAQEGVDARLLPSPRVIGTYLGILSRSKIERIRTRISSKILHGDTIWTVSPPPGGDQSS